MGHLYHGYVTVITRGYLKPWTRGHPRAPWMPGKLWGLPTLQSLPDAIENGQIVDLPSYKMVDLSIVMWMFTRG